MATFYKITNKQIYEKLEKIEEHVMKTNGKVTLNKWIATTALTMFVAVGGVMANHLLGG